mgnify:CR=1 FL=1
MKYRLLFLFFYICSSALTATAQLSPPPPNPAPQVPRRLTLAEAERLLLDRNLAVAASKYQIEASRAARLLASYKPNPLLTVGAEQLVLHRSPVNWFRTNPDIAAQGTYTVRLDKLIERGGKRELRIAQSEAQIKANEALLLDAVRTQMFQLRQAYVQATLARKQLQLAEQVQRDYEQTVRLTEAKVEQGDLAGLEVYRARAGLLQYQQQVLQSQTTYQQATRDVLNLLGAQLADVAPAGQQTTQNSTAPTEQVGVLRNASYTANDSEPQFSALLTDAPLELVAEFEDRPLPQALTELRTLALQTRPDVQAARHVFEAQQQGVLLARAQRIRDWDVATEIQRVGTDQTVGATWTIPLFLYNNQRAAITQAEAQQKASETLLHQAELQAMTDVEKAFQAYTTARRTLDLFGKQNLAQIEKLRTIANFSFKEGASSLFELLDAQRTYNAAQAAYNQARADYQLALWQLEQATGAPLR